MIPPLEPFQKEDRVLILAPHPDDENIGCGGVIQRGRYNRFSILDATKDKYLYPKGASLEFNPESVIFKIPFSALGDPDGFLFGFETPCSYMPLGITAFRAITIE